MKPANEFVVRKTLPEFYESIGGKMRHPELMDGRRSTGYSRWMRNYCKAIGQSGADAEKVLSSVRNHLFTRPYDDYLLTVPHAGKKSRFPDRIQAIETLLVHDDSSRLLPCTECADSRTSSVIRSRCRQDDGQEDGCDKPPLYAETKRAFIHG